MTNSNCVAEATSSVAQLGPNSEPSETWVARALKEAIEKHALPSDLEPDGNIVRFDRAGVQTGWVAARLTPNGDAATLSIAGGDHKSREEFRFSASGPIAELDGSAPLRTQAEIQAARSDAQAEGIQRAQAFWDRASGVGVSPYFKSKGLPGELFGCRVQDARVTLVPFSTVSGEFRGVQFISPTGQKHFIKGLVKKGAFHAIGEIRPDGIIRICEGIATAASIQLATGDVTLAASDAGNLEPVAVSVRARFPDAQIIICGDDDRFTMVDGRPYNTGRVFGMRAAHAAGASIAFPKFSDPGNQGTDFNDLHVAEGLERVREQLTALRVTTSRRKRKLELTKLDDLMQEPEEDIPFIVDGMLVRGGTSIFAAKPKVGKTTLSRQLAVAVARGTPFLGRQTVAGPVLVLAVEEKRSEVKKHFKDIGVDGTEDIYVHASSAPDDALELLYQIAKDKKPALIIIDTLFKVVRMADGNDYAAVTNALEPINELARETGAHVMCVHHLGKADRDGADAILGSTAILGAFDTAIILSRTESGRVIETRQRYGKDLEKTRLEFNEAARTTTLGETKQVTDRSQRGSEVHAWLVRQSDPQTVDQIAESVGGRNAEVAGALNELVRSGRVLRGGTGKRGSPFRYQANPADDINAERNARY